MIGAGQAAGPVTGNRTGNENANDSEAEAEQVLFESDVAADHRVTVELDGADGAKF